MRPERTRSARSTEPLVPVTLGEVRRTRPFGWFSLTELRLEPGRRVQRHAHRRARLTIVRAGSFTMDLEKSEFECAPGGVFFKRRESEHTNRIGPRGLRSLVIEIDEESPEAQTRELALPERSFQNEAPGCVRLAAEVQREFDEEHAQSALALECLVLELLSCMTRDPEPSSSARRPRWLREATAILAEHFREPLALRELAGAVGVHPVHLAQTFRRYHPCTVGEYVRRLRLAYAEAELRETGRSIAQIAQAAGFHDQPHLTRAFKQRFGLPPGAYRARVRRH